MTPEERAEFEDTERDAQLWRYLRSDDYRPKGSDDPCIMLIGKDGNGVYGVISAEEARMRIEKYYERAFDGQGPRPPKGHTGAPRPSGIDPYQPAPSGAN